MTNNRDKYRKNRQLWRKVYGPRRRKPDTTTFIDPVTSGTITYDLHRTVRHRDFFIIRTHNTGVPIPAMLYFAEYDEGLVAFNNTDTAVAAFNFCFSTTPDAVVLTVDGAALSDSSDFIIPYGITFNSCSMSIGVSAPFSGNIRYRAVYSSTGYPALASSSLEPSSGTFKIAAGAVVASQDTAYTASYPNLGGTPTDMYKTPWDFYSNFDVDVSLTKEAVTTVSTVGEISAPLSNPIFFIAVNDAI